ALLQRGVEGLHAAAVQVGGRAIALVGDCGYGKSTPAAHALRNGARLLTDDLLVCAGSTALPGAARIKLEPTIAQRTLGARAGTPMYDHGGKWIYALADAEFAPDPVPLAGIFALQHGSPQLARERLSPAAAFHALLAATFNPLEQNAARLASHMRYHAALSQLLPVFRLCVPRRIDEVDTVLPYLFL
ncbi:MAG: hypothetical protein ACT443_06295, partial [Gemmatimonadota bacterium]